MKRNQVIIYAIALMLVAAGYLNYTSNIESTQVSSEVNEVDNEHSDIGDAKLVSSEIDKNNTSNINVTNTISNDINEINNDTNITQSTNNTVNTNNINYNTNSSSNTIVDNQVQDTSSQATTKVDDYFSKSKLERDTMYSQTIETYQNILDNNNVPESQKNIATEQITKINEIKNSIMICENLIQTKGFKDCVIFANGDSISVVIQADKLEVEDIAQIQNIVAREMNASIENIHISNK